MSEIRNRAQGTKADKSLGALPENPVDAQAASYSSAFNQSALRNVMKYGAIIAFVAVTTYNFSPIIQENSAGLRSLSRRAPPQLLARKGPRLAARTSTAQCIGWSGLNSASLNAWCQSNCAAGNCPDTMCMCTKYAPYSINDPNCSQFSATTDTYTNWCSANCPSSLCSSTSYCYCSKTSAVTVNPVLNELTPQLFCPSGTYFGRPNTAGSDAWCQASCSAVGATDCPGSLCSCDDPYFDSSAVRRKMFTQTTDVALSYANPNCKAKSSSVSYNIDFGNQRTILYVSDAVIGGDSYIVTVDDAVIGQVASAPCTDFKSCIGALGKATYLLDAGPHNINVALKTALFGCSSLTVAVRAAQCDSVDRLTLLGTTVPYASADALCRAQGLVLAAANTTNLASIQAAISSCVPVTSPTDPINAWIASWNGQAAVDCMAATVLGSSVSLTASGACTQARPVLCYRP